MADIEVDNLSQVKAKKRGSSASILLPPLLFFSATVMTGDFMAVTLTPLKALHIPYSKLIGYGHLIVPGACAVLWLVTRRKWPNGAAICTVLLCFTLASFLPRYAERQVAHIAVSRFLTPEEREALKSRISFPIFEHSSSGIGNEVLVAPANEAAARDELKRVGVLSGQAQ